MRESQGCGLDRTAKKQAPCSPIVPPSQEEESQNPPGSVNATGVRKLIQANRSVGGEVRKRAGEARQVAVREPQALGAPGVG